MNKKLRVVLSAFLILCLNFCFTFHLYATSDTKQTELDKKISEKIAKMEEEINEVEDLYSIIKK